MRSRERAPLDRATRRCGAADARITGDEVDVERDAGIAQRDETDLEPPLHHRWAVDLGVVADVRRKLCVVKRETRDGDVVSLDANVATEIDGFHLPEHRFSSPRYLATDPEYERLVARRQVVSPLGAVRIRDASLSQCSTIVS